MDSEPATPSRWKRRIGFAVGLTLIAAAAWAVLRNRETVTRVTVGLDAAPVWAMVVLVALPAVNWLLTSMIFTMLTRLRAGVTGREMTALVGASWLLNFLPLSPGLLGRIAYQKAAHALPVRTSLLIVVESVVAGWVALLLLSPAAFAVARGNEPTLWVVLAIGLPWALGMCLRRRPRAIAYAFTVALRVLDLLVWTLRYVLVFLLVGREPGAARAFLIAFIAQTAMSVPFLGNGLGLREWVVGLLGATMPPALLGAAIPLEHGLSADLINRAAEILAAIPIGLGSALWLARHAQKSPAGVGERSYLQSAPQADPTTDRSRTG